MITGDLNASVGSQPILGVVGEYVEPTIGNNGKRLNKFSMFNEFKITNTFFYKRFINK